VGESLQGRVEVAGVAEILEARRHQNLNLK
jgi:hypothetical protein